MKNKTKYFLTILVVYIALLIILVKVEANTSSGIDTIFDAIWYSLVTLTTVGYGDTYPLTYIGKIIGGFFILCSMGLLASLLGLAVNTINSKVLPYIYLKLTTKNKWYIFYSHTHQDLNLAKELYSEDSYIIIMDSNASSIKVIKDNWGSYIVWPYETSDLLKLKAKETEISYFILGENDYENYQLATSLLESNCKVYCRSDITLDKVPANLVLFNPYETIARTYWKDHPLKTSDKEIILIGEGKLFEEMLSRALLNNVYDEHYSFNYHCFNQTSDYLSIHHEISKFLFDDTLTFYDKPYYHYQELVENSSRIIICFDKLEENIEAYNLLKRYVSSYQQVHIYLSTSIQLTNILAYGLDEAIYTESHVLNKRLNLLASTMHQMYLDSTNKTEPTFDQLSEFTRQSNIAAADHLETKMSYLLNEKVNLDKQTISKAFDVFKQSHPTKKDIYRKMEHNRWLRFHSLYNWRYGEVRNNDLRIHPLMLPFEDLSEYEQSKDDYAWNLLESLQNQF